MNETPIIEMEDVTVTSITRADTPEIENIRWRVRPGDFWVINGQHGSGKSDFMATAAGLQKPLRGIVRWFGRNISDLEEAEMVDERKKIGLVFENGGRMFRQLSVVDNVSLPLRYHRDLSEAEATQELKEVLELTDLSSRANTNAGTLGPSWQQRVALARALVSRPEILLFDKPTIGLGHLRWWLDFMDKLLKGIPFTGGKPITLVVTTEDIRPWLEVGRQFAAFKQNQWHLLGERSELAGKEAFLRELWAEDTN